MRDRPLSKSCRQKRWVIFFFLLCQCSPPKNIITALLQWLGNVHLRWFPSDCMSKQHVLNIGYNATACAYMTFLTLASKQIGIWNEFACLGTNKEEMLMGGQDITVCRGATPVSSISSHRSAGKVCLPACLPALVMTVLPGHHSSDN